MSGTTATSTVLGPRALNRALLSRQLLDRRSAMTAAQAVEHLVGLQSQAPLPPYYALWNRLADFAPDHLGRLLLDRSAVRIALMRGTIHLVTADDCLELRPLLQPVLERGARGNHGRRIGAADPAELAEAGRALVERRPMTFDELGRLLAERWPGGVPGSLAATVRSLVPLVQPPPRGVWGRGGPAVHTTAESWLGRPMAAAPSVDRMVLRYLAAFGPATIRDVQTWSGLTRLREVADRLSGCLVRFQAADGAELLDLPDAPRPDPEAPVPVRLLGEFDSVLLGHADRSRIMSEPARARLFTVNGIVRSTVLLDGFAAGTWTVATSAGTATLTVELFDADCAAHESAIAEEGGRLLEFAAPRAARREVRVRTAG
ncbi:winged helix DNA-binding domain-containing protein [Allonocardiopsis opalescens]|uniref:Winged helix DNA-binding protein n=1 Tax=Allonocardiopsis opalescens TaxID=1144618 RepID=A0A2T0Q504_9ACTN|nr:winged helix DNA-binding domain-containing protein [Allonocardiopsis opalescens]PRX98887.1 winged helix DNA-binding protein [Allonocardiopsis opalescens]